MYILKRLPIFRRKKKQHEKCLMSHETRKSNHLFKKKNRLKNIAVHKEQRTKNMTCKKKIAFPLKKKSVFPLKSFSSNGKVKKL